MTSQIGVYGLGTMGSALALKFRAEEYAVPALVIDNFCTTNFVGDVEHVHLSTGLSSQAIALCRSIAMCGREQGDRKSVV